MSNHVECLCAVCCSQLASAQQYWPVHAEVANWLAAFEEKALLSTRPADIGAEASELLALIVRSYQALPRLANQPPF